MVALFMIMFLGLFYSFCYVLFHAHLHFDGVSILNGSYTSAVADENFPRCFVMPKKDCSYFLLVGGHFC